MSAPISTKTSFWSKSPWPVKVVLVALAILILGLLITWISSYRSTKGNSEPESCTTAPKQVYRLQVGVLYTVDLVPGKWQKIGPAEDWQRIVTYQTPIPYYYKSDCHPKIEIVGGGRSNIQPEDCRYISISALPGKPVTVEYEIVNK
ncbi:hypothetical protein IT400_02485 [Candidatus Nomurabacteria bacterium]|nr:hypothetical protein [Candidatus Nomurabacteria bacterium]